MERLSATELKNKIMGILNNSSTVGEALEKIIKEINVNDSLKEREKDITLLFLKSRKLSELIDKLKNIEDEYKNLPLYFYYRAEFVDRKNIPRRYWEDYFWSNRFNIGFNGKSINRILKAKTVADLIKKLERILNEKGDGQLEYKVKRLFARRNDKYFYKWTGVTSEHFKVIIREDNYVFKLVNKENRRLPMTRFRPPTYTQR